MNSPTVQLFAVGVGLVAANFVYQAFRMRDWKTAIERSYYETVALLIAWWLVVREL